MNLEKSGKELTPNEKRNAEEALRDRLWRDKILEGVLMGVGQDEIGQEAGAKILAIIKEEQEKRGKKNTAN